MSRLGASRLQAQLLAAALIGALLAPPAEAQMHHAAEVECLAFSDDGNYMITVTRAMVLNDESLPTRARIWDLDVGAVIRMSELEEAYRKQTGHKAFYLTVATCQIDPPILGILHGTRLNLWDWQQQSLAGTVTLDKPAYARGSARLYRSGAIPGAGAAFVEVAYGPGSPPVAQAFAVPSGKPWPELEGQIKNLLTSPVLADLRNDVANVAFAGRGGARVAFANYRRAGEKLSVSHTQEARVWDQAKRRIVAAVPSDLTGPIALSKEGTLVATVRGEREVKVFHVDSGRDYLRERKQQLALKAEQMGVAVRHGYRPGAIGERAGPGAAAHLYSASDQILYLDDRPVSIERLASEIEAEPDQMEDNYNVFFGVQNRSDRDMIVDLLIEVPISTSDWEKVISFWEIDNPYLSRLYDYLAQYSGGYFSRRPDVRLGEKWVLQTRQSRLLLRRQFGLRAGGAVKDQISVGEREPVDLSISILSISAVEPGWLDGLELALTSAADSLESAAAIQGRIRGLMNDRRALGYRRSLSFRLRQVEAVIAGHVQQQWRGLLTISVGIPDDYDPDFFNDVQVRVTSAAESDLRVLLGGPDAKPFTVVVPANGARTQVVQIQRVPRDQLVFKVLEVEIEK